MHAQFREIKRVRLDTLLVLVEAVREWLFDPKAVFAVVPTVRFE